MYSKARSTYHAKLLEKFMDEFYEVLGKKHLEELEGIADAIEEFEKELEENK